MPRWLYKSQGAAWGSETALGTAVTSTKDKRDPKTGTYVDMTTTARDSMTSRVVTSL